jgi:hypothetical protein
LGQFKPLIRPWPLRGEQSRYHECLFSQLRLGKVALNKPLFKIKRFQSPESQHCQSEETVFHLFITCPIYSNQRRVLFQAISSYVITSPSTDTLLCGARCNPAYQPLISVQWKSTSHTPSVSTGLSLEGYWPSLI